MNDHLMHSLYGGKDEDKQSIDRFYKKLIHEKERKATTSDDGFFDYLLTNMAIHHALLDEDEQYK